MPVDLSAVEHALVTLLRERARAAGMTQEQVASAAGISQPRVSRIFGHSVALSFSAAMALCDALGIGLDVAYREARETARARR